MTLHDGRACGTILNLQCCSAVRCYIPLEEDQAIKTGGKFIGTTPAIAYDALVDGICRKTTAFAAKAVHFQKKKLITMSFLHTAEGGIVDAKRIVAPLKDFAVSQGEGTETVGTIERRLYVTRQLGVTHKVENMKKYYAPHTQLKHSTANSAPYKLIAPAFLRWMVTPGAG
ncbi:hypothetical protein J1614_011885 [Plenodomus biglobosus]|nr:hypothetical protein J1614_011885 [Plenodomus biglobosus]